MNILFITAQPFLPQMMGGLQRSSSELALNLKARGHRIGFLTALMPNGLIGIKGRLRLKLTSAEASIDHTQGFPVYRAWFPWESVEWVCKKFEADVVVVLARESVKMAKAAQKIDVPVAMMLQDVEFSEMGGEFVSLGPVPCIANSRFTARRYQEEYDVDPSVIYPMVAKEKYYTTTTRENVTFINTHPAKGLDIALDVARACPEIPFHFVETWPLSADDRKKLQSNLASLDNVIFSQPVKDMRQVYAKAGIVMAPSRWEEAFGRVGLEPQISGIPVVATNIGGLPEAVGEEGVLIDRDQPASAWAEAIRKLWNDHNFYQETQERAFKNADLPHFDIKKQAAQWEQDLLALCD